MHVVVILHEDGDSYLKYLVDKIFLDQKTIEDYAKMYPNRIVIYQGKGYLNGQLVSTNPCLQSFPARINVDSEMIDFITDNNYYVDDFGYAEGASHWDSPDDNLNSINVFGNVYYVVDTDGTNFELNEKIHGYGSF